MVSIDGTMRPLSVVSLEDISVALLQAMVTLRGTTKMVIEDSA